MEVLCIDRRTQPYTLLVRIGTDGAYSFDSPSAPVPGGGFVGVLAVASRSVAAVATASAVLVTIDGGAHWHQTLACGAWLLGYESPTEACALCAKNRLWRSNDGGQTWSSSALS